MNKFVSTMGNITTTENAMPAYKSTLNPCLNLFYRIGNRNKSNHPLGQVDIPLLARVALEENEELAIKIIGWSRSVRDGAGVRQHLRDILSKYIVFDRVDWSWFGKQGYWKDLFYLNPDTIADASVASLEAILATIREALDKGDNLMLKWLPRRKRDKNHKNSKWAYSIRHFLGINEKEYRKICTHYSSVETQMCANQWSEIDYTKVPSKSLVRNKKAFLKHDAERFNALMEKAAKGEVKVKAGAVYPHEILKLLLHNTGIGIFSRHMDGFWSDAKPDNTAEAMWKSLPDKFKSDKKILVVGDTSGSMTSDDSIYISLALTIYCAERLTGAFHNFAVTFSERPAWITFDDKWGLDEKLKAIPEIVANTNIEAVFDMMLHFAKANNIPKEDMPEMLLIISDMQFDSGISYNTRNMNIGQMLEAKYKDTGYDKPAVVYWNVRNSSGIPVEQNEKGVVLFSGASPNSITQALEGEMDPVSAMMRVVDKDEFYWLKR